MTAAQHERTTRHDVHCLHDHDHRLHHHWRRKNSHFPVFAVLRAHSFSTSVEAASASLQLMLCSGVVYHSNCLSHVRVIPKPMNRMRCNSAENS